MSDARKDRLLEQALRDAYAIRTSCPPPEAFLRDAGLSPDERARVDAHAEHCPACGAERELARRFHDPESVSASEDDVRYVIERLRAQHAGGADAAKNAGAKVIPHPALARRKRWPALPLAAAAAVLVTVGVTVQVVRLGPPALPEPPAHQIMRGATMEALSPLGELATLPEALRWTPVAGAARYRVSLLAVDDAILWTETVTGTEAQLPEAVKSSLYPAVRYRWTVEALGDEGTRLAWSDTVSFRARPQPAGN